MIPHRGLEPFLQNLAYGFNALGINRIPQEQSCLTECIYQQFLESQLPHKIFIVFNYYFLKFQVDGSVGDLTF